MRGAKCEGDEEGAEVDSAVEGMHDDDAGLLQLWCRLGYVEVLTDESNRVLMLLILGLLNVGHVRRFGQIDPFLI